MKRFNFDYKDIEGKSIREMDIFENEHGEKGVIKIGEFIDDGLVEENEKFKDYHFYGVYLEFEDGKTYSFSPKYTPGFIKILGGNEDNE